jgi:hypothetical protein
VTSSSRQYGSGANRLRSAPSLALDTSTPSVVARPHALARRGLLSPRRKRLRDGGRRGRGRAHLRGQPEHLRAVPRRGKPVSQQRDRRAHVDTGLLHLERDVRSRLRLLPPDCSLWLSSGGAPSRCRLLSPSGLRAQREELRGGRWSVGSWDRDVGGQRFVHPWRDVLPLLRLREDLSLFRDVLSLLRDDRSVFRDDISQSQARAPSRTPARQRAAPWHRSEPPSAGAPLPRRPSAHGR